MKYFEIRYYRTHKWIDRKCVATKIGATDAIKKTRIKNIVSCEEITKDQYDEYKARKKELRREWK